MPGAAKWIDIEMIKVSEISQIEKDKCYDIAFMQNLKEKERDTNEVTYKTETHSQTQKTNLWLPKQKGREEG